MGNEKLREGLLTALLQDDIIVRVGQQCGSSSGSGRYVSAECFRYSGDGDELITPVYTAPTLPPYRVSPTAGNGNFKEPRKKDPIRTFSLIDG